MREIKDQVRPITERLSRLQQELNEASGEMETSKTPAEWSRLSTRLEDLRTQWNEWETRLEDATERKLIFLGHLVPKP